MGHRFGPGLFLHLVDLTGDLGDLLPGFVAVGAIAPTGCGALQFPAQLLKLAEDLANTVQQDLHRVVRKGAGQVIQPGMVLAAEALAVRHSGQDAIPGVVRRVPDLADYLEVATGQTVGVHMCHVHRVQGAEFEPAIHLPLAVEIGIIRDAVRPRHGFVAGIFDNRVGIGVLVRYQQVARVVLDGVGQEHFDLLAHPVQAVVSSI